MRLKKVKLTHILLFIAAGIIDLSQEIKDPFNLFSSYYKNFYGELPPRWQKDKLWTTFSYCLKRKYLKKNSDIKKNKFFISKKGEDQLKKNYPQYYYKQSDWDKKIRLVIFDIQELNRHKRDYLRRLLKQLGFIMLQKSVWISPYNQFKFLKPWLKENNLEEKILLLETNQINIKNKNWLLSKFWRANFSKT